MQLTIAEDTSTAPAPPDVSDPSTMVWRDGEDTVVAVGQTVGDRHWVHVPRLGAFSFARDEGGITALPEPAASPELVEDAFRRMILPLALQAQGREVLHASAVRMPAGVVALCAVSGTGKSTIACALSRRGHELWADDAVCFEPSGAGRVEALPLPFTLRLRPASAAHFGDGPAGKEPQWPAHAEPLAAVFVLERSDRPEAEAERLAAGAAFREVLTHGYCFSMHDRARNAAMVRNYLELVDRVPVFRLSFPDGLDGLGELVTLIEDAASA